MNQARQPFDYRAIINQQTISLRILLGIPDGYAAHRESSLQTFYLLFHIRTQLVKTR